MTKLKLVTDAQGREFARLARGMRLPRATFQTALTDGTGEQFLRGLVPNSLEYPNWVRKHLTPEFEATELRNPGEVEPWLDPHQESSPLPTGHDVYEAVKEKGLLERSLSFGNLKWYEGNPNRIPPEFNGKLIWGWASVAYHSVGFLHVPCLDCIAVWPYVYWRRLGRRWWSSVEPAGLRK